MKEVLTISGDKIVSQKKDFRNLLAERYRILLAEFVRGRTGYSAIAIIGQSCLGSVAVMLLLMHDMPVMIRMGFIFLVTIFCLGFNAAVLTQLPPRTTFNMLLASALLSCGVIIANLI